MKTCTKHLIRRILPCLTAGVMMMASGAASAADVAVPRLIKLIIPYAPGGSTDLLGRNIASALGKRLNTTVIAENRPGGGSVLGTNVVAKSTPDGSTILLTTTAFTIGAGIQEKLPYDPVNDFVPLAMLTEVPMILAVPASSPYRSTADLINAARAQPGKLNYGTSGIGSSNHMGMELFKAAGKLQIVHVPYKGMAPAALDLASGQVQAIIGSYSSLAPVLQSGKVRALAVSSLHPSAASPDLPAISAVLPGFNMTAWFAMFAPAKTPPALVELMNREIRSIIASDEFTRFFAGERATASTMDLATMANVIRSEIGQWRRIANEQGIKAE